MRLIKNIRLMTNPFKDLGISDDVVNAVKDLGFETPTPIQEQSIPVLLEGTNDFVGLAQTGTGKTAAFGLPLLELIDFEVNKPQALILCPTRELCLQITNDLKSFAKNTPRAHMVAVYGGASITQQLREIRQGVRIVVATPGRMLDIIGRKAIDFSSVKFVVLDEADEMLNMGFQEDINDILATTPDDKKNVAVLCNHANRGSPYCKKIHDGPCGINHGYQKLWQRKHRA